MISEMVDFRVKFIRMMVHQSVSLCRHLLTCSTFRMFFDKKTLVSGQALCECE
jgi:hypothetical protein